MAQADVFYLKNDMLVTLSGLQSSTDTSSYINSSTGVTTSVWSTGSTGNTANRLINERNVPYVSGSDGDYRVTIQHTESTGVRVRSVGMAIVTLSHQGMNAEWRVKFRGEYRSET